MTSYKRTNHRDPLVSWLNLLWWEMRGKTVEIKNVEINFCQTPQNVHSFNKFNLICATVETSSYKQAGIKGDTWKRRDNNQEQIIFRKKISVLRDTWVLSFHVSQRSWNQTVEEKTQTQTHIWIFLSSTSYEEEEVQFPADTLKSLILASELKHICRNLFQSNVKTHSDVNWTL